MFSHNRWWNELSEKGVATLWLGKEFELILQKSMSPQDPGVFGCRTCLRYVDLRFPDTDNQIDFSLELESLQTAMGTCRWILSVGIWLMGRKYVGCDNVTSLHSTRFQRYGRERWRMLLQLFHPGVSCSWMLLLNIFWTINKIVLF